MKKLVKLALGIFGGACALTLGFGLIETILDGYTEGTIGAVLVLASVAAVCGFIITHMNKTEDQDVAKRNANIQRKYTTAKNKTIKSVSVKKEDEDIDPEVLLSKESKEKSQSKPQ